MGFNGKLTISRYTGGAKGEGITISIVDDLSGVSFVEVEVDPATFGRAVTGQSYLPCEVTEWHPENVGKVPEVKTEYVLVPKDWRNRKERAAAAVAEHETDGWRGDVSDAMNYHHLVGKESTETYDCYSVTFRRYVDPPQG